MDRSPPSDTDPVLEVNIESIAPPAAPRKWARQQEFDDIALSTIFTAPMTQMPLPVSNGERIFMLRNAADELGKLMTFVEGNRVFFKWVVYNVLAECSPWLPPISSGEGEATIDPSSGKSDDFAFRVGAVLQEPANEDLVQHEATFALTDGSCVSLKLYDMLQAYEYREEMQTRLRKLLVQAPRTEATPMLFGEIPAHPNDCTDFPNELVVAWFKLFSEVAVEGRLPQKHFAVFVTSMLGSTAESLLKVKPLSTVLWNLMSEDKATVGFTEVIHVLAAGLRPRTSKEILVMMLLECSRTRRSSLPVRDKHPRITKSGMELFLKDVFGSHCDVVRQMFDIVDPMLSRESFSVEEVRVIFDVLLEDFNEDLREIISK